MRARYGVAIAAVILVGFGLLLIFFSAPIAEADIDPVKSVSMNVSEMHHNIKNLPVEELHDMTFVFSDGD